MVQMVEEEKTQYNAKIAVLGDTGVGKSCLISVFSAIENKKTDSFAEILDNSEKTVGKHKSRSHVLTNFIKRLRFHVC